VFHQESRIQSCEIIGQGRFNGSHIVIHAEYDNQDVISLTMVPPDPLKAHFDDLRLTVPIQLTTDPWNIEGTCFQNAYIDSESLEIMSNGLPCAY
jgi:hypothetical protein